MCIPRPVFWHEGCDLKTGGVIGPHAPRRRVLVIAPFWKVMQTATGLGAFW
jgi:hypothetical protein